MYSRTPAQDEVTSRLKTLGIAAVPGLKQEGFMCHVFILLLWAYWGQQERIGLSYIIENR